MESSLSESSAADPAISILVPTKKRPEQLSRMLESLAATAHEPSQIEAVLGFDEDDQESLAHAHTRKDTWPFTVQVLRVASGSTMGQLNNACLEASTGYYVMAMNDDVLVRTPGWDVEVRRTLDAQPDGIALAHVDDGIFGESLCTFPLVSRLFCELAGGLAPAAYRRYRIDDHIHEVFRLLAYLGHSRTFYFPDILFEHLKYQGGQGSLRTHVADPEVLAVDAETFESLRWRRQQLALRLEAHIEEFRTERRLAHSLERLSTSPSGSALRSASPPRVRAIGAGRSPGATRVTIAVMTPDLGSPEAAECLASIRRHSDAHDLVVLELKPGSALGRGAALNRLIADSPHEHLVIVGSHVVVGAGWIDGLLHGLGTEAAAVAPVQLTEAGSVFSSGVVLLGDEGGSHSCDVSRPAAPRPIETLDASLVLLDLGRCGGIEAHEAYLGSLAEVDLGLQLWEAGCPIWIANHVSVERRPPLHPPEVAPRSREVERDRVLFGETWIRSGRLARIEAEIWCHRAALEENVAARRTLHRLTEITAVGAATTFAAVRGELEAVLPRLLEVPVFAGAAVPILRRLLSQELCPLDAGEEAVLAGWLREVLETTSGAVNERQA